MRDIYTDALAEIASWWKDGIFTYTNIEETGEEALGDLEHV